MKISKVEIQKQLDRILERHHILISLRSENNQYVLDEGVAHLGKVIFRGNGREILSFLHGYENGLEKAEDVRLKAEELVQKARREANAY